MSLHPTAPPTKTREKDTDGTLIALGLALIVVLALGVPTLVYFLGK
jgi:uncharacterized protein HemX